MAMSYVDKLQAKILGDESTQSPVVVLLHGFGASGSDLVPLAQYLKCPPDTRFVFPQAPLSLGALSYAWWMIDIPMIQYAMTTGNLELITDVVPDGLDEASDLIEGLLDEVCENLRPTHVFLGGFSQGAMLSIDVALRTKHRLSGLCVLSGALVAASRWRASRLTETLNIFQSHGELDPVLPLPLAQKLTQLLDKDLGSIIEYHGFLGGHEIPPKVLTALGNFITDRTNYKA